MKLSMFLFFSVMLAGSIWVSHEVWTNPDEYLRKVTERRHRFDNTKLAALLGLRTEKYLGQNRNAELWFARLIFAFQYALLLLGMLAAVFAP